MCKGACKQLTYCLFMSYKLEDIFKFTLEEIWIGNVYCIKTIEIDEKDVKCTKNRVFIRIYNSRKFDFYIFER